MKKTILFALMIFCLSINTYAKKPGLVDENGVDLFKAEKVFTLVNLHPDEQNSRLYATNYQLPALIPLCTEVKLQKLTRKALIFEVPSRSKTYTYLNHKSAVVPFNEHLQLFFGASCDAVKAKMKKMGKKDKEGIKLGRAMEGMTRDGVLLAMGRPPMHVNPVLDVSEWMYWRNKFGRTAVMFDDKGKVTGTR